ncbi:putative Fe-S cluster protein YjdI [Dyadobacter jejuensis]|uniref:Putative Fe-S cluster protein YjdI n=1 Tax=Dyadobacter jejuensis TaxID=1082580 RepID=A0A316A969_9BACT|nr:(4Fe-4S)-binding protein [Dyadobacter jejuensis]PWJ54466.1 putative Fe-S cluster protein YjdI [Dyadobacter jejuensis]
MIKEYSNGEITIKWQADKCQHAGVCVMTLPRVYNPKASPWIDMAHATTEELKDQINKCPSGALSYYTNEQD